MPGLLEQLRQLEVELHHPGVRCSRERLEQLLHPQFHEVGRSGRRYDRETVVRFLAEQGGPVSVRSWNFVLHPLAEDCALLTYESVECRPDGTQVNAALRASVWRRGASGWQIFHHQGTPAFVTA